ncbi:unnamed protein product [Colias eurytheme]|nr:unnamed protein product [Colias eurytheme]
MQTKLLDLYVYGFSLTLPVGADSSARSLQAPRIIARRFSTVLIVKRRAAHTYKFLHADGVRSAIAQHDSRKLLESRGTRAIVSANRYAGRRAMQTVA